MVEFSNSTYIVDEGSGPAQLLLFLSNPLSSNITVCLHPIILQHPTNFFGWRRLPDHLNSNRITIG